MTTKASFRKRFLALFLVFSIVMTMVPNISLAAYADYSTIQRRESDIKNSDMFEGNEVNLETYNYPGVTSAPIEENIPIPMLYSVNSSSADTLRGLPDYASTDTLSELSDDEEQYEIYEYNGNKYSLFDIGLSWTQAKEYCEELGGHLISINSQDEQMFVNETLLPHGKQSMYWTGGYRDFLFIDLFVSFFDLNLPAIS